MTTIVIDRRGERNVIAADRQAAFHSRLVNKLVPLPDGSVLGCAGAAGGIHLMIEWLMLEIGEQIRINNLPRTGVHQRSTFPPPKLADGQEVEMLRMYPDGRVTMITLPGTEMIVSEPFFSIGSGSDYAMGALAAGATVGKAIEIASRFDPNTGGGYDAKTMPMALNPPSPVDGS